MTDIILTKEDTTELFRLYHIASETPVIYTGLETPGFEKSLAHVAWDEVQEFQKKLGAKYGYDWKKCAVNKEGKIILVN